MLAWSAEERLRRQAALWFARMRGPEADRHRAAFEAWSADPRHSDAYARLQDHWAATSVLTAHPGWSRALEPRRPHRRGRLLLPAVAATTLAVLATDAGWMLHNWRTRTILASAVGQRRTVALADGSKVILDADSMIAPEISGSPTGARTVRLLRGRARFLVAHAGTPFVLYSNGVRVTAHGTVFDVDRFGPGRIDVSLLAGAVEIDRRSAFGLSRPMLLVRLQPGETARLRDGHLHLSHPAPASSGRDWTAGLLVYDHAPLGEVLADANRYGPPKIRLASPLLAELAITGVFRADATAELAISLARALGLNIRPQPGGDLMLSRQAA